jgi:hypothetical protein
MKNSKFEIRNPKDWIALLAAPDEEAPNEARVRARFFEFLIPNFEFRTYHAGNFANT